MYTYRYITFLILFVSFTSCDRSAVDQTEILWDEWGVPHIYARNTTELFYATGWAQMESHGNLILRLYGEARGRAAEYWGERYFESDRWMRTMGIPNRADAWYELQTDEFKEYLKAFTDGINDYVSEHPDLIDTSMKKVLPVTPVDILAHAQRIVHFTFIANPAMIPAIQRQLSVGSNAWAIAPSRTGSGNTMLLINPHLPWSESFFRFFEIHQVTSDMNLYGATLVGLPGIVLGFNEQLGWTHTVNTIDAADTYILTLRDGGYLFDGEIHNFEETRDTIFVRNTDGDFRPELLTIRKSVHGPVIVQNENRAVALRVAGLDALFMIDQWWRMGRANNLEEFKTQLKRMQLPMFTVMYADREGNIMHFFAGAVPVRQTGDWNFWQGMVPGDTPATLWSDIHPYEDLPLVLNPPTGWLQNANDPPWTTTFPLELHPDDYPPYMAPAEYGFRAQQSAHLLMDNDGLSFHQLADLKHNTRMKLADRVLDELLVAVGLYGNNTGRRAAGVLSEWDRTADADSRGAFLFEQWAWNYNIWQNFEIPFSLEEPFTTPSGLADPQGAVRALERVAERIESTYGSIDVKWGDVYRLRIDDHDFPVSGGPGNLGIFRVFGYDRAPTEDNQYIVNFGDSFVAAVEFSNPLRAQVLTAYGNATQRHLPHRGDQLELLASKQMRDALLTREEVEANSITRIRLK